MRAAPFVSRTLTRTKHADSPYRLRPDGSIDTSHLIVQDDEPVDSIQIEKQQKLLTDSLYSSWKPSKPFIAVSNVGLFFEPKNKPFVPDMMLSVNAPVVPRKEEYDHRSYFVWVMKKVPDVVIEIISDRRGGELTRKWKGYAAWGIPYYVLFDPDAHYKHGVLRALELVNGKYVEIDPSWLPKAGIGLALRKGSYAGMDLEWLRWIDAKGKIYLSGEERGETEAKRAETEAKRADAAEEKIKRLTAKLHSLGHSANGAGH